MSVPAEIGRYRLDRPLGTGGFAVVWLAHDVSLETSVAIKVLAEHWADRMDVRDRFLAEARMLRQAASPHVVQVFDIGELPDGRPYFVMEHADHGTLGDRAGAGSTAEALRRAAEVARGVADLHAAGIVHRDVKPSNVLVRSTRDGGERLLVADLGVAKDLARASGLTMSVGSAGYMAPEQAGPNAGVDVRADVYSLGALAYHLVTGAEPGPPGAVMDPPAARAMAPGLRQVLLKALEVRPERRWPDAATLAGEFERLAGGSRRPFRRRPSGRWTALVLVLLLALGVAGAGFWWVRPVTVRDDSGRIAVAVPRAWDRQIRPHGWDPTVLGLARASSPPGLVVADHADRWSDLARPVNGVFVGLSGDPGLAGAVGRLTHAGCRVRPGQTYSSSRWRGPVRRWDRCPGSGGTLVEAVVTAVGGDRTAYVQIRQAGGEDRTVRILDGLRVNS
jgi:eukaryotic-like serine/threonine-protein kinase